LVQVLQIFCDKYFSVAETPQKKRRGGSQSVTLCVAHKLRIVRQLLTAFPSNVAHGADIFLPCSSRISPPFAEDGIDVGVATGMEQMKLQPALHLISSLSPSYHRSCWCLLVRCFSNAPRLSSSAYRLLTGRRLESLHSLPLPQAPKVGPDPTGGLAVDPRGGASSLNYASLPLSKARTRPAARSYWWHP